MYQHFHFANRAPRGLAVLATCLFASVLTWNAAAQDLDVSTEGMPSPVGEEGNPFADYAPDDAQTDVHDLDLFDEDPDQFAHEDEQYYGEDDSYCFDEGCGAPVCGNSCRSIGWYKAGYVFWWSKGVDPPPLATTSPVGTDPNQAGVLGQDTTSILFGASGILGNLRGGGQFELGYWLDPQQTAALELNYFFLGEKTEDFFGDQDRFPILARPFLNVETGLQDARLIALNNQLEGTLAISTDTNLHTSAVAYRNLLYRTRTGKIDYLLGYRFAYLGDTIAIGDSSTDLRDPNNLITLESSDFFETRNMFHGGEFGFEMQHRIDHCWDCVLNARVALGGSARETIISGSEIVNGGDATPGGLLTQPSNIGAYRDTEFNTVSNLGVTFRRRVLANTSLSFGYHLFLWSHVWRAADQIDSNVNESQPTSSAPPLFPADTDTYWAQGLSINLEGRF